MGKFLNWTAPCRGPGLRSRLVVGPAPTHPNLLRCLAPLSRSARLRSAFGVSEPAELSFGSSRSRDASCPTVAQSPKTDVSAPGSSAVSLSWTAGSLSPLTCCLARSPLAGVKHAAPRARLSSLELQFQRRANRLVCLPLSPFYVAALVSQITPLSMEAPDLRLATRPPHADVFISSFCRGELCFSHKALAA